MPTFLIHIFTCVLGLDLHLHTITLHHLTYICMWLQGRSKLFKSDGMRFVGGGIWLL